jgi:hypothetical protein
MSVPSPIRFMRQCIYPRSNRVDVIERCLRFDLHPIVHAQDLLAQLSFQLYVRNQLAFRHSSRRRPWKLSTCPFCIGLPGWMWIRLILRSSAEPSMRRDVNSGPLSERTLSGRPRCSISRSSARVTRPLPRLVSASSARHSRVNDRPRSMDEQCS